MRGDTPEPSADAPLALIVQALMNGCCSVQPWPAVPCCRALTFVSPPQRGRICARNSVRHRTFSRWEGNPPIEIGGFAMSFKTLVTKASVLAMAAGLAAAVASAPAQAARTKIGVLTCNVGPGIGMIVGSTKHVSCEFAP